MAADARRRLAASPVEQAVRNQAVPQIPDRQT